ncbi:prealbumin-like fold domain-containing protein [Streptomyces sp. DSM 40907]|uniref:prealbumin-like fold domain-containing protein n=1 Tax=Streptomyces kutzneri TaxID=3051179 RepID=UPI0028D0EF4B|nr:prealbumin-like fold domain-containing protein [Streptomyces sp. DSM 40907]
MKKTDKHTGKTLPGAIIATRADETDKTGKHTPGKVITSLTTGTDGTATVPLDVTLKAGTRYWARETKAPDGYQLDATPVAFTARPGADVTVNLADKPTETTPPSPSTPPATPPATTPPTTPPGSLAHTGADATTWLAGGATALLAAGGGLYLINRRRTGDAPS